MILKILQSRNLQKAYRKVLVNKGSCGVDWMKVSDLDTYLSQHRNDIVKKILEDCYLPSAIKGVEIPKNNDERMYLKGECPVDIQ